MNKSKFEKKCLELIEHEDKTFEEVKNYIKQFDEELNKCGYEICVRRFWFNHSVNNGRFDDLRIEFNRGYNCLFSVQFQNKGADPDDENGIGFQITENSTAYGINIFSYRAFVKWKLKYLYKKIQQCFVEVIQNGLEATAKKYNKN